MKNLMILIFSLILIPTFFSMSQPVAKVIVYLKNGYSVKGEITEQTDKTLKIKTMDGQIFEYPTDEVDKISSSNDKNSSNVSEGIKTLSSKVSQEPNDIFVLGDQVINVGIGNNIYTDSYYTGKMPPISASYELCVKDALFDNKSTLGVGGFLSYAQAKDNYGKYSNFNIGVRSSVHYQFVDKLDTYAGLMLRYQIDSYNYDGNESYYYTDTSDNRFRLSIHIGARYYFNDQYAAFVEFGGVSFFKIGAAIKF